MKVEMTACGSQIGPTRINIDDVMCETDDGTKVYVWHKGPDHVQVTVLSPKGACREFHIRRTGIKEKRI